MAMQRMLSRCKSYIGYENIKDEGMKKNTFADRFELEPPDVDELPLVVLLRFWPLLDCSQTGKGKL